MLLQFPRGIEHFRILFEQKQRNRQNKIEKLRSTNLCQINQLRLDYNPSIRNLLQIAKIEPKFSNSAWIFSFCLLTFHQEHSNKNGCKYFSFLTFPIFSKSKSLPVIQFPTFSKYSGVECGIATWKKATIKVLQILLIYPSEKSIY